MPIVALPQTTVRAIGSTSVISDPCSVVKELIDNALDASASFLQVEISQNTLSVIQVKDNGHGIPTEDHANVCKHTFTSKIQTLDDLKNVGGSSFGFRGEALASVVEMSGGLTVSTRSASEVTGTCLKYARDGSLLSSTRTSHPAGTTLRITDFLKFIPVRRQTSLKDATKTLTKIKKLLQAYAFAHPGKRFSMKVLKAKNENNNWMYAPSADAEITDAAMKIVGRDVSSCCVVKKTSSESFGESGYDLLAFLPKADADMVKSNNQGQFISVDGRPLSISRGIGQDVAKLFKSYARAAASRNEAAKSITDPFLCIQLKCLQGSYDVNIEPGKDDVLFEDRELVMSMIEGLFRNHYGPLSDAQKASAKKAQKPCSNTPQTDSGFEILMSRTRPQVGSSHAGSPEFPANIATASPLAHRISPSSGLSSPEGPRDDASQNAVGDRPVTAQCRGSRFINPWSISRINASFQTPRRERPPQSSDAHTFLQTPQPPNDPQSAATRLDYQSPPQSPELTSSGLRPASISPVAHRRRSGASIGSPPETIHVANSARKAERQRDKERYGNGALDTWFQRTVGASLTQESPEETAEPEIAIPALSQLAKDRFQPPTHSSAANAVASLEGRKAQNDIPEVLPESPSSSQEDGTVELDHNSVQEGSMNSGRGFPVLEKWAASLHEGFNPVASLDLEWALDFEKRKKEANQKNQRKRICLTGRDGQESSQSTSSAGPSPHKNRYLAAKAALTAEHPSVSKASSSTSLSSRDPRAYLMRHQTQPNIDEVPKDSAVARRLHTSRLPFERTPEEHDVHDICTPMSSDISLLSKTWNLTCSVDAYARSGKEVDVFPDSEKASVLSLWNDRLIAIFNKNYTTRDNSPCPEWQVDLASIMAQHLKQFPTN